MAAKPPMVEFKNVSKIYPGGKVSCSFYCHLFDFRCIFIILFCQTVYFYCGN